MNKTALLMVLCSLFTAFSCSNSSGNKDKSNTIAELIPYFPAATGSKWVYINEAPREETVLFTVEVKDLLKDADGFKLSLSSFPFMTADNTERTLSINSSGDISVNDYNGTSGVFIPSEDNFNSGYRWSFGIYKCSISDFSGEIKSEEGNYSGCKYVYMTDGFTFSFEMWFKKGTGIVKWGANRTNPPILKPVYYVLKELNLQK